MTEISISIPDNEWLTANGRLHWSEKARRTKVLRTVRGWMAARSQGFILKPMEAASVVATIHYPANRRQDPANASPTVKALIDGCVDAGLLPDDDAEHLTRVSFERGEPTGRKGWYAVTLRFEEVE